MVDRASGRVQQPDPVLGIAQLIVLDDRTGERYGGPDEDVGTPTLGKIAIPVDVVMTEAG